MKNLYYLFMLFICPIMMWAQPTITVDIAPEIGDAWEVTYLEPSAFDPGPSGANQTWDFSSINLNNTIALDFQMLAPTEVLGNENFPTADFVWHIPAFEIYEFYEVENDSISLVGGVSISNGEISFMTIYTNAEDGLHLPLNYQDSYNYYSYFEQYFAGNFLAEGDRNGTVTADGHGTIITPDGTYDNVLRVKIQETSFGFTNTQYAWYDVNNFTPIMVYEESEDPETPPSLYFSEPMLIDNNEELISPDISWKAWYNSTENTVMADLSAIQDLENANLSITDLQGRALVSIQNAAINDQLLAIKLPLDINTQLVFLSIQNGSSISTQKVFIGR